MAIPIEATTVVLRLSVIQPLLTSGRISEPNGTCLQDQELWRCCFMDDEEAQAFLRLLAKAGLNVSKGPNPDAAWVTEYDQKVHPYCEWLTVAPWDKAVIAWLTGTTPDKVVAREGWDPAVGSRLNRLSAEDLARDYTFVESQDGVETYAHRQTGERIYLGRSEFSPQRLLKEAAEVVGRLAFADSRGAPPPSAVQALLEAEAKLDRVIEDNPNAWTAWWMLGKSRHRRGQLASGRQAFREAVATSGKDIRCLRELAGICLEMGEFSEALEAATQAVIADPANHELIANQAICFLLADRVAEAQKSIAAAVQQCPHDAVNRNVETLIRQVATGVRERPRTLQEAMRPAAQLTQRRPWWKFW